MKSSTVANFVAFIVAIYMAVTGNEGVLEYIQNLVCVGLICDSIEKINAR